MIEKWPPPHQVRRSRRARNIGLSINPKSGLEIILPLRASMNDALDFLDSKRRWVERHLKAYNDALNQEKSFPTEVVLSALGQTLSVRYHHIQAAEKIRLKAFDQHLVFAGPITQFDDCLPSFNRWLRKQAKNYLPEWLAEVSKSIQLPFDRVSVRAQKTLWGSCNHKKQISLNDRLLFLPYELVRYVLIHELCHTVYLSHGKRFWQLVSRFDPDFKNHERSLRDVSHYIPSYFRP
ncbi:MAG: M48 family metallopeptidase [Coxiellaceae bacterium]|nr:M48 family metallopeptidase [Coxiellaceae bacterium]